MGWARQVLRRRWKRLSQQIGETIWNVDLTRAERRRVLVDRHRLGESLTDALNAKDMKRLLDDVIEYF